MAYAGMLGACRDWHRQHRRLYTNQSMINDLYGIYLANRMEENNLRATIGLLATPDQLEALGRQPPSPVRLPMSPDQQDFVLSDEEDGVLALKNGADILYVSLYWRARYAINNLARVHHITPRFDRLAVVRQETVFEHSGLTFTTPNRTNLAFADWGPKYPGPWQSAHAGEELPIAKVPAGLEFKPGQESVYAGKGSFYALRYGPYLIGMNTTVDQTFELAVPAEAPVRELVSGRSEHLAGTRQRVGPRSTAVFFFGPASPAP